MPKVVTPKRSMCRDRVFKRVVIPLKQLLPSSGMDVQVGAATTGSATPKALSPNKATINLETEFFIMLSLTRIVISLVEQLSPPSTPEA